jgi:pSer/pThr/pTyr-binding forkhead associated (FHA) protein
MVQLSILSGPRSGERIAPQRYPFRVGRAADSDLRLDQPGVWSHHLSLEVQWTDGVWLQSDSTALTTVNSQRVEHVRLRNGDLIEAGSVRMRFSLSPARQRGMRWREALLWSAMAAVWIGQGFLILWWLP